MLDTDHTPARVLLVEDDDEMRGLVARYLIEAEFVVDEARAGVEMDTRIDAARPDLVVLDVNLPGEDGFAICLRLRNAGGPPVLMLTSRSEDIDRILGLELGADDYLAKPFNPRELIARIRAIMRRSRPDGPAPKHSSLSFDGYELYFARRHLFDPSGVRIVLTGIEFDVLRALAESDNRVLSREQLRNRLPLPSASTDRSIDIVVSRLRQKIERNPRDPVIIQTVRSLGYYFVPVVARA